MTYHWTNHWPTLSAPLEAPTLRIISHGGGTQTVALCLMAARGDIGPMPDAAIFADTGDEADYVYWWLGHIRPMLPFPLIVVRADRPSLGDYQVENTRLPKEGRSFVPFYTLDGDKKGMLPKQCNSDWKKRVVRREAKRLLRDKIGLAPTQRFPEDAVIEQWIGISTDEKERTRISDERVIHNRYPLIELNMSRGDCIEWGRVRQYPRFPRSSCIWCPFRTNEEHRDLLEHEPHNFERACVFDELIRVPHIGFEGTAYVHRDRVPLRQADLSTPEDLGQGLLGFIEECSGSCGT